MSTHHVSAARLLLRRIGLGFALAVSALATHAQTAAAPLELKVINHGANSFYVNSVLVQGAKEAVLLDAGFTRADALRVAAAVLDSGKKLTTIYVSAADPDYYFGLEVLRQEFPEAKIVAAAPTLAKIDLIRHQPQQAHSVSYLAFKIGEPNQEVRHVHERRTVSIRSVDAGLSAHVWQPRIV